MSKTIVYGTADIKQGSVALALGAQAAIAITPPSQYCFIPGKPMPDSKAQGEWRLSNVPATGDAQQLLEAMQRAQPCHLSFVAENGTQYQGTVYLTGFTEGEGADFKGYGLLTGYRG